VGNYVLLSHRFLQHLTAAGRIRKVTQLHLPVAAHYYTGRTALVGPKRTASLGPRSAEEAECISRHLFWYPVWKCDRNGRMGQGEGKNFTPGLTGILDRL